MSLLIDAAVRSSILLALGLAIHTMLRRRSAALRHAVVGASIVLAAVVVPLSLALPSWIVPVPALVDVPVKRSLPPVSGGLRQLPLDPAPTPSTMAARPREDQDPARVSAALGLAWAAGAVFFLVMLAVRTARMMRMSARARPLADDRLAGAANRLAVIAGVRGRIAILESDTPDLIATWGVRPRILLPPHASRWSDERINAVLCHEIAHVRRRDWAVQMAADVVRALYWCNPLIWAACRALRRDSELACDDQVLAAGVAGPDYADQLLALASVSRSARSWAPMVPMARRSTLERRIAAMLDARLDRRVPSRRAVLMTILLLAVMMLPTAALRAGQANPQLLTGSVYDASGAVLPGVRLTLQDEQEFKWEAVTNASGRFEFPPVRGGKYVLSAAQPGFREMKQEFTLQRNGDWDRAITLGLGQLSETIHVTATRTAPPPPPAGPQRLRVGGNIKAPHKLTSANPVYPASMREAGRGGLVPIDAVIGTDGRVLSAWVAGGHVHPDFAKSALEAVRQWTFSPTLLNGVPVEVAMTVLVNFTIAE